MKQVYPLYRVSAGFDCNIYELIAVYDVLTSAKSHAYDRNKQNVDDKVTYEVGRPITHYRT